MPWEMLDHFEQESNLSKSFSLYNDNIPMYHHDLESSYIKQDTNHSHKKISCYLHLLEWELTQESIVSTTKYE